MSISSFYKLCSKNFKKATKKTDYCPICKSAIVLAKKINNTNYTEDDRKEFAEEYRTYEEHYATAQHQRNMFSYQRNNLAEGACLIIMDYKQNIKIGGSRIESSRDFYRKTDVTVFGFCLYYKLGGLIYKKNIDYFSEALSYDSFFTKQAIKELLRFDLFKYINNLIF